MCNSWALSGAPDRRWLIAALTDTTSRVVISEPFVDILWCALLVFSVQTGGFGRLFPHGLADWAQVGPRAGRLGISSTGTQPVQSPEIHLVTGLSTYPLAYGYSD